MSKECIILAGGLGTRLQSVVADVPKCMATVAGKPFLHYIFNYLEKEKISHVVLSLGYKSDIILNWIQEEARPFAISHVVENEALGTGGAIKLAFSKIKSDHSLVINGDTFFKIDTSQLIDFHTASDSDISLALKPMCNFDRYGSVLLNNKNRITQFVEKKQLDKGLINGGIYYINKRIFEDKTIGNKFSFEKEILENKLQQLQIVGLTFDNYFIDIGIPADYEKANTDFIKQNF